MSPLGQGVFARRGTLHRAIRLAGRRLAVIGRRVGVMRLLYRPFLRTLESPCVSMELAGLPALFEGYRIAHLTDLHAGLSVGPRALHRIVEQVNDAHPDLIALTGDLVAYGPRDLPYLLGPLAGLRARDAVVAVPGNHEYFSGRTDVLFDAFRKAGVEVLVNRSIRIERGEGSGRQSLLVAGVDDGEEGTPCFERALHDRRPNEPVILLAHEPDAVLEAARHGVTLQLSGHTHGGQIRLPWLGTPFTCTPAGFVHGRFMVGDTHLYVSRGVGAVVLPCRIGASPEVPFVVLGRIRAGLREARALPIESPVVVMEETCSRPTSAPS